MSDVVTLFILTLIEVLLGIDNLLFISIAVQNVKQKKLVRYIGLSLALVIRIIMLIQIKWILEFDLILVTIPIKSLILGIGGFFLVIKSAQGIYRDLFCEERQAKLKSQSSFYSAILQIVLIDLVFSLDSVLTAIALTNNITIIILAFIVAMFTMIRLSEYTTSLLQDFPRLNVLSFVFIMSVGGLLMAESMNIRISRGYLYTAFIFSLIVEFLNITLDKKMNK